jgi:hypothetical protein
MPDRTFYCVECKHRHPMFKLAYQDEDGGCVCLDCDSAELNESELEKKYGHGDPVAETDETGAINRSTVITRPSVGHAPTGMGFRPTTKSM